MLRDPMIYQRLQTTRLLLSQISLYFECYFTPFQPNMMIWCPIFNLFFIWAEILAFNRKFKTTYGSGLSTGTHLHHYWSLKIFSLLSRPQFHGQQLGENSSGKSEGWALRLNGTGHILQWKCSQLNEESIPKLIFLLYKNMNSIIKEKVW